MAVPAAAQDQWASYSTPQGIGSFEAPCEAGAIKTEKTASYESWSCSAGAIDFIAGIMPIEALAPDDFSAEELAAYTFDQLEAEAEADPEITEFLAVEYGGMPAFHAVSIDGLPVSHVLSVDLGDGNVLLLLAMSYDVIGGTADGKVLADMANRFLISFKVTPQ